MNDKLIGMFIGVLITTITVSVVAGCNRVESKSNDPRILNGTLPEKQPHAVPYPFPVNEDPDVGDRDAYRATEYCYKGVVYVVFNPGGHFAVAAPRYDPLTSKVVACDTWR